ncbi:MAG: hypothetical protein LBS18_07000 [Clostridiales bacterium]|jgi:hypothetical protein|nr:hypothetical protein [Clostridiales bacterium]
MDKARQKRCRINKIKRAGPKASPCQKVPSGFPLTLGCPGRASAGIKYKVVRFVSYFKEEEQSMKNTVAPDGRNYPFGKTRLLFLRNVIVTLFLTEHNPYFCFFRLIL